MAAIQIRIGAAVDPSIGKAFVPLEQAAARAEAKVRGGARRAGRDQASLAEAAAAKQAAAAEKAAAARVRADAKATAAIARAEAGLTAQAEREAQKRARAAMREFDERLRASKRARAEEERDILRVAAAANRADRQRDRRAGLDRTRTAREFGHRGVSAMGSMGRAALGVAGDIARGAGVDLTVGGAVARNVELETKAVELANLSAEYDGDKRTKRISEAEVTAVVKQAADRSAFSRVETMEGLHKYAAKTGDVEIGMGIIEDLGALSRATGTELGDMVSAAGDVSIALGEMGSKAEKIRAIKSVMATFAGQGKEAAVEIKDLSAQMAKLSASATGFEGSREDILAMMGTFAQMSRQAGGSASTTQATTSVQGLVNTLKTPARVKRFEEEGISVVNRETGLLRNPQEIIKAALARTEGDPIRMKKMFANIMGARAVEGFSGTYRTARADALGRGATREDANIAGIQAVQKAFDKFNSAKIGQREIDDAAARSLETTAAKAQQFQNRLDDVAASMQARLVPALERAAPGLIRMADGLARVVAWTAENPGKAITLAIVAAIGKAGIETAVGRALSLVLERALGAAGGAGAGAPGAGGAGRALAVGAAGILGFGIGKELHDADASADKAAEASRFADVAKARNAAHAMRMAGSSVDETDPIMRSIEIRRAKEAALAKAEGAAGALKARIAGAHERSSIFGGISPNYASAALNWVSAGSMGSSLATQSKVQSDKESFVQNAAELVALKVEMAKTAAAIEALGGKTLRVHVENQVAAGASVDPTGRTPATQRFAPL